MFFKNKEEIRKLSKDDCEFISYNQELSENFIRQFQDKVNWNMISFYQTLSEDFIRQFQDKVNWLKLRIFS
jgi:hypothetical protein